MTIALIRQRRDTAANWASENPILPDGQLGFEVDTRRSKLGNGTDPWLDLSYVLAESIITVSATPPPDPVLNQLWLKI